MLSWGLYGPVLHKGQLALGNPQANGFLVRRSLNSEKSRSRVSRASTPCATHNAATRAS